MKKKKIIKKTPTRVHAFRCTDEVWSQLKELAKECGISLNRYLTETGLKHHPHQQGRGRCPELPCLCQD